MEGIYLREPTDYPRWDGCQRKREAVIEPALAQSREVRLIAVPAGENPATAPLHG